MMTGIELANSAFRVLHNNMVVDTAKTLLEEADRLEAKRNRLHRQGRYKEAALTDRTLGAVTELLSACLNNLPSASA